MDCPACGTADAYVGLTDIDCSNGGCRYFHSSTASNPATAVASQPTITIVNLDRKQGSILITFTVLDKGDPTNQVSVEFYWSAPTLGIMSKTIATLSNSALYHVPGVTADGITIYRTHWMCISDGVNPMDAWKLEASLVP